MNTRQKSIKYQFKKIGGSFDLDELTYEPHNENINFENVKYIAGPVSLVIIENEKYKKKLYLFGDKHVFTNKFDCQGNATPVNTIYLPDYLRYYFDKTKNIPLALFIEIHY